MYDILFRIPGIGLPVHSYGVMAMFGFLAGVLIARWRAKKVGLSPDAITDVLLWALIAGLVGSRIAYVILEREIFFAPGWSLWDIFKIWEGGLVFYGGFIGAFIAVITLTRMKKLRILAVLDVMAPSVALGHAFGRMGCFLRGCCYGVRVRPDAWYGVVFPEDAPVYHPKALIPVAPGSRIFPSQVVSSLDLMVIFVILMLFFRHRRTEGQVTGLYLVLYSIHRFTVEFFRADTHLPGVLSPGQWVSIFAFFFGLGLLVYAQGHGTKTRDGKLEA